MIEYADYIEIIRVLKDNFKLTEVVDHKYIHTMNESDIELFRFMFGYNPETKTNELYTSFHLDINPIDAILWFKRLELLNPSIKLVECYYRDDRNEVYTGQDAEIMKMYKEEQLIISNWDKSQKETEAYVKAKIVGRRADANVSHDQAKALEVFSKMVQNDDDTEH